jgi:hypothetical protein
MSTLGLIAGNGQFPILVAREARRQGRTVVALPASKGKPIPSLAQEVWMLHWMKLGQIKRAIEMLKRRGADEAVMAGQVKHVSPFLTFATWTPWRSNDGHTSQQKNRYAVGRGGGCVRERGHPIPIVGGVLGRPTWRRKGP